MAKGKKIGTTFSRVNITSVYGNTDGRVFKRRVQNQNIFCLIFANLQRHIEIQSKAVWLWNMSKNIYDQTKQRRHSSETNSWNNWNRTIVEDNEIVTSSLNINHELESSNENVVAKKGTRL